jgi:hypothetical protein
MKGATLTSQQKLVLETFADFALKTNPAQMQQVHAANAH